MNRKNKKVTGPAREKIKNSSVKKLKSEFTFFESKIMAVLKKDREHKFASRELLRKTGLKDKEKFYESIRNLAENGHIITENHVISINKNTKEVVAELVSLSRGFGFARPENGGEDIFIHGSMLNSAFVGDKILIGGIRKDDKGYSGNIMQILEKGKGTTTGTIQFTEYGAEVIPDNKIRYNPSVSKENLGGAKEGDKVMVQLIKDYRGDWTQAKVLQVFGSGESARVCADAIIELLKS